MEICIKKKSALLCLLLMLSFSLCLAQSPAAYELLQEKGVWVEHFDSTQTAENRFTANNSIYKEGFRFTYRYFYLDTAGRKFLQKVEPKIHRDREKAWKLVPLAEKDSLTNDRIELVIESDLQGIAPGTAGFNHTPIRYEYFAPAGQLHFLERKSLVENKKNLWIQPPSGRLFRILALNPYPFILAPYAVGQSWEWQQSVPSYYSDARWKEWKEPANPRYQYRISKKESINTLFGTLLCLVIEAKGSSSLGNTSLISHFHPQYGFVRLLYTNIDGSQLLMELVKIEEE